MIGTSLAHYTILDKLGEGGMGVVYKARDSHLDRLVAIKVLPPCMTADPERKRRFIQEAKAASALNHPNIVTVHDVDSVDGSDFIVMEYVSGSPLDRFITCKALTFSEALRFGIQIADALARAHSAGIIHRDIKPANIMVTDEGRVKLLDFGLAKLVEHQAADESTRTATLNNHSEQGMIVGTAAYMSPEQAEGKPLDTRSDIFSFGVVLYELLAGRRPFQGDSRLSTLAAIIHSEPPPLSQSAPHVPAELERIVSRCLRRDPAKRFQHMLDLKVALEELKEESESGGSPAATAQARRRSRKWILIAAATVTLVIATAALWFRLNTRSLVITTTVRPFTSSEGFETWPSFSPDGKQVVFAASGRSQNFDLYVMLLAGGTPLRLTTDGDSDYPAWSPDGTQIAFLRGTAVLLVSPLGGPEKRVTEIHCKHLTWTPDARWLVVTDRDSGREPCSIYLISPGTRERRRLTTPPAGTRGDAYPAVSPDGRHLAFTRAVGQDTDELWVMPAYGGTPRQLTSGGGLMQGVVWTPDGREIVYSAEQGAEWSLWRIPAKGGHARPVANTAGGIHPALSPASPYRLIFAQVSVDGNIWRMAVPNGVPEQIISSTRFDYGPRYSPDGSKLVFVSNRTGSSQLWVADADGSHQRVLLPLDGGSPRWSPDGTQIAFDLERHLEVVSAEGGEPKRLTGGAASDNRPAWSRDGRWIYFRSNRSGNEQIWKMPALGGNAIQLTSDGGWEAIESPDGQLVFYTKDRRKPGLWSVPAEGGMERLVAPSVSTSWWGVARDGIYFVDFSADPAAIKHIALRDRSVRTLRTVKQLRWDFVPAFTVTNDGRWVAWSQLDRFGADLMLVENFR